MNSDFQRRMRLYLINIWGSPEFCEDPADFLTVSQWSTDAELIRGLMELNLITSLYSERNLEIDRWFLHRASGETYPPLACSYEDACARILFRVIFQALKDVRTGRPCDLNLWDRDLPPDLKKCSRSEHICWNHAEEYLLQLEDTECLIQITPEFIRGLVREIRIQKPMPR